MPTYVLNCQHARGARQYGSAIFKEHADRLGHVALLQMLQHRVLVLEQQSREQFYKLLALQIVNSLHGTRQQQFTPEHDVALKTVYRTNEINKKKKSAYQYQYCYHLSSKLVSMIARYSTLLSFHSLIIKFEKFVYLHSGLRKE